VTKAHQQVFVGIGCNLGERAATIETAVSSLADLPGCDNLSVSSLYETEPLGPADQPDYLNAVAGFDCALEAHALLDCLQQIEQKHGRVRTGKRWGPRTLDLDLLLYGRTLINSERLTVPHPGIAGRSFVLVPLLEIEPNLVIPGKGNAADLLADCPQLGIKVYNLQT